MSKGVQAVLVACVFIVWIAFSGWIAYLGYPLIFYAGIVLILLAAVGLVAYMAGTMTPLTPEDRSNDKIRRL